MEVFCSLLSLSPSGRACSPPVIGSGEMAETTGGEVQLPAWLSAKLTQAQPPPQRKGKLMAPRHEKNAVLKDHQPLTQILVFFGLESFVCDCLVRKQPGEPVPHRDVRTYKYESERVNVSAANASAAVKRQLHGTVKSHVQTEKWRRE